MSFTALLAPMNSCEMHTVTAVERPGTKPRFLSQKVETNDPLKKIPSTTANATRCSVKVERVSEIQERARSVFPLMLGIVSTAVPVTLENFDLVATGCYYSAIVGAIGQFSTEVPIFAEQRKL